MKSTLDVFALGAMDSSAAGEVFRTYFRGFIRESLTRVLAEEVNALCGPAYHPQSQEYVRAGSAPGNVLHDGKRMDVVRPRVRKGGGKSAEVQLATYKAAQDPALLEQHIIEALMAGVSSRDQKRLHGKGTRKASKSEVSRLWQKEGARLLEEFRARDISQEDWVVLMLDGIGLGNDLLAIAAIGITLDGRKVMLDFEIGSSESFSVCRSLLRRISKRGFGPMPGHGLFVATDGSPALRKGVNAIFDGAQIQRCLIHKERNLKGYLSKRHWGELASLFKRLRHAEGEEDGREALAQIRDFAQSKNSAAAASLDEAGDDLIRMHILGLPATLGPSLLSTNIIENSFRNTRRKIGRVARWRAGTDQPSRWLAYALTEAEKGFRRIRGSAELPLLKKALALAPEGSNTCGVGKSSDTAVTPLRATPSAPSLPPSLT